MALFPGIPRWAGTRKVKPIWILLKQETVSGSGISWAICKSAPRSRQITMPAPHHSSFLQAGCPSYRPTNSDKALEMEKETRNGRHDQRTYSVNDFGAITLLTHLQSVHSSAVRARVVDCWSCVLTSDLSSSYSSGTNLSDSICLVGKRPA